VFTVPLDSYQHTGVVAHARRATLPARRICHTRWVRRREQTVPTRCLLRLPTTMVTHFKKEYGNPDKGEYVRWFLPFAALPAMQMLRASWRRYENTFLLLLIF
jgi:hypothetical protein